ncbi:MAG TPA: MBL fold metallo-hydrolase [Thermoanaerobaculia bacterium]|nr:MBL fold metallo-hydrolase [Thermoanaerobaculia bacterium]
MAKMTPPPSGVKIRMYRQGFGDCFLLAFPTSEPDVAWYVLVDCGLFWAYSAVDGGPSQSERMDAVVRDLELATGGVIDTLVVTHEHFDHLAGFHWTDARDRFQQSFVYGELWLAWTERREGDALADELREEAGLALGVLSQVQGLLPVGELLDFSKNTASALVNARALFDEDRVRTLDPGEVVVPLGEGGPRFFILGPPRDRELLRTNLREDELFARLRAAQRRAERDALLAAARGHAGEADDGAPFARHRGIRDQEASESSFFVEHYGRPSADGQPDQQAWRRIDGDWLEALADLALQYDDFVNNTSLAFAIELPESRRVLLFPGDAQSGNWLSWADEEEGFSFLDAPGVTVHDLLSRTVLYKVGHHGSHNATLDAKGLARMTSDKLVALVPTDEEWAWQKRRSGWRMPYLPLYRALLSRTRGRVVQSDIGLPDRKKKMAPHPNHGGLPYSEADWEALQGEIAALDATIQELHGRLVETDLFFEMTIPDEV